MLSSVTIPRSPTKMSRPNANGFLKSLMASWTTLPGRDGGEGAGSGDDWGIRPPKPPVGAARSGRIDPWFFSINSMAAPDA